MASIKYLFPHWGSEHLSTKDFFNLVVSNDFDGIEINLPRDEAFKSEFFEVYSKQKEESSNFVLVLQQVFGVANESSDTYLNKVLKRLESFVPLEPDFINSHTGKDHYSFDENCKIIEAIEDFSVQNKIPVYHEIHRGRFTFHSQSTLKYLEQFPNLKFVGDFSHWCVVSESMLQDQQDIIKTITPHIFHLHARVSHEQASQVNNPFAPEWREHLEQFVSWWHYVVKNHKNPDGMTITPEFGPFPYMPNQPFTREPLSDQKAINIEMRNHLKSVLK